MYGYVYKITNKINNKYYIGKRAKSSFDEKYWGSGVNIKRAIERYGKENFYREILDTAESDEELNEKEKFYIGDLYLTDELCYNLTEGGKNNKRSPEVHKRQSKTLKESYASGKVIPYMLGKHISEEQKMLISKNTKNAMWKPEIHSKLTGNTRPRTDEEKKAVSERFKGVPKTEEHKRKISEALTGVSLTEERKQNISKSRKVSGCAKGGKNPRAKKVVCVETSTIYSYSGEAAKATGANAKGIRNCCLGKYKTSGGLHWRFLDDNNTGII